MDTQLEPAQTLPTASANPGMRLDCHRPPALLGSPWAPKDGLGAAPGPTPTASRTGLGFGPPLPLHASYTAGPAHHDQRCESCLSTGDHSDSTEYQFTREKEPQFTRVNLRPRMRGKTSSLSDQIKAFQRNNLARYSRLLSLLTEVLSWRRTISTCSRLVLSYLILCSVCARASESPDRECCENPLYTFDTPDKVVTTYTPPLFTYRPPEEPDVYPEVPDIPGKSLHKSLGLTNCFANLTYFFLDSCAKSDGCTSFCVDIVLQLVCELSEITLLYKIQSIFELMCGPILPGTSDNLINPFC